MKKNQLFSKKFTNPTVRKREYGNKILQSALKKAILAAIETSWWSNFFFLKPDLLILLSEQDAYEYA